MDASPLSLLPLSGVLWGLVLTCNYCLHFSVERFAVTRSGVHQLTANTPTHLEVTAVQCVKVSPHLSSYWLEFE